MRANEIYGLEKRLPKGKRLLIMGIVNVTPDSFSDGGQYLAADKAVAHALQLVNDGADIIDLGAESTRPGAQSVDARTQTERLLPVLKGLRAKSAVPVSVDTTHSGVAEIMLANGADIINDISAARFDAHMLATCKKFSAPIVLMHMLGTPQTMQQNPNYGNVTAEVGAFLKDAAQKALAAGLAPSQIILDPGLGFGKTPQHNWQLVRDIPQLAALGYPLLIAASRKSFLRKLLEDAGQTPSLEDLDTATQVISMLSQQGGAQLVRVHNVKQAVVTRQIIEAL